MRKPKQEQKPKQRAGNETKQTLKTPKTKGQTKTTHRHQQSKFSHGKNSGASASSVGGPMTFGAAKEPDQHPVVQAVLGPSGILRVVTVRVHKTLHSSKLGLNGKCAY